MRGNPQPITHVWRQQFGMRSIEANFWRQTFGIRQPKV